jgi:hypothetical protein
METVTTVVSQKQVNGKVRKPKTRPFLSNRHSVSIQMAALSAGDHLAQCPLVLPFGFATSLRRETRLQDWTHRYPLRYRDLEEMMQERGVEVDHSTINRWGAVVCSRVGQADSPSQQSKRTTRGERMKLTSSVLGQWKYLYRAVDSQGSTLDFLLSAKRDAKAFLAVLS